MKPKDAAVIEPFKDPKPPHTPLPSWLMNCNDKLKTKYADDSFEIIFKGKHWKIQCNDCHGKIYAVGPYETLENYDVHMKSRTHRSK